VGSSDNWWLTNCDVENRDEALELLEQLKAAILALREPRTRARAGDPESSEATTVIHRGRDALEYRHWVP
jgi:hypothetical protein